MSQSQPDPFEENLANPPHISADISGTLSSPPKLTNSALASQPSSRETSMLLDFLYNLALANVTVIKLELLQFASDGTVCEGNSMEVRKGRLQTSPSLVMALKLPHRKYVPDWNNRLNFSSYQSKIQDILFEIRVMTHNPLCKHRNIVPLIGVSFMDTYIKDGDFEVFIPILVVPYAESNLMDYYSGNDKVTYDEARGFVADIADGLEALHLYGLVHADLKPDNILLFEDSGKLVAKLADFGYTGSDQDQLNARGYTVLWTAPEILLRNAKQTSPSQDIYSFGLLSMFILLRQVSFLLGYGQLKTPADVVIQRNAIVNEIAIFFGKHPDLSQEAHKWLKLVLETIQWDPMARMRTYDLGAVRTNLFGQDCFKEEKIAHYRNLVPIRGMKGHPDRFDNSFTQWTMNPLTIIDRDRIFNVLPLKLQQQLITEYYAVDWYEQMTGNILWSRSVNLSHGTIDRLLSIPPPPEDNEGKMWRGMFGGIRLLNMGPRMGQDQFQHLGILPQYLLFFPRLAFKMAWEFAVQCNPFIDQSMVGYDVEIMPKLWLHALKNDIGQIQSILEEDPTLLREVHRGSSIGHFTALANKPKVLRYLIEYNADIVHWRDSLGRTPIYHAIKVGSLDCVRILLDAGSDLTVIATIEKKSPLGLAYSCSMPTYGIFPPAPGDGVAGHDRRKILEMVRERGDFHNDNGSRIASIYIHFEGIMISLRQLCSLGFQFVCLTCIILSASSWSRLTRMFILYISADLFQYMTRTWNRHEMRNIRVKHAISKLSITFAVILYLRMASSKLTSFYIIFLALTLPKIISSDFARKEQPPTSKDKLERILCLMSWVLPDYVWIYVPEMTGLVCLALLGMLCIRPHLQRRVQWKRSSEIIEKSSSSPRTGEETAGPSTGITYLDRWRA